MSCGVRSWGHVEWGVAAGEQSHGLSGLWRLLFWARKLQDSRLLLLALQQQNPHLSLCIPDTAAATVLFGTQHNGMRAAPVRNLFYCILSLLCF